MENNKIDTTMRKKYYELYGNKELGIEVSLCEYIDNSIGSIINYYCESTNQTEDEIMNFLERDDDDKKKIEIINDLKKYNLNVKFKFEIICDQSNSNQSQMKVLYIQDNAFGIQNDKLFNSMELGKTYVADAESNDEVKKKRKKKNSMNVYGVGMKYASFEIGYNAKIYTKSKTVNGIDDFVSIGNYDAPLSTEDERMNQYVKIKLDKSKDRELLEKIGESGTIIEVQGVNDEYFNLFTVKNKEDKLKDVKKTLGMKYTNYLKSGILKIIFENESTDCQLINSSSMLDYDDNNSNNPFVIKKYYDLKCKDKLNGGESQLKNLLNQKFMNIINDESCTTELKNLFDNNEEFRNIFSDVNKPLIFKVNCEIKDVGEFPVTIGILMKSESANANVNVIAQWRYINQPSFEKDNKFIKQFNIDRNDDSFKSIVSANWSFFEFNLRDLPKNKELDYFIVDENKQEFIKNKKNQSNDVYEKKLIKAALYDLKRILVPFTDIFKNLDDEFTPSTISKAKYDDEISKKFKILKDKETNDTFFKHIDNEQKIFLINKREDDSNIVIEEENGDIKINTKNSIFMIGKKSEPKWMYLLIKLNKKFNELKKLKKWIIKNNDLNQIDDEIKEIIDNFNEEIDFMEYLKNEQ